jgi:hypothetical protein
MRSTRARRWIVTLAVAAGAAIGTAGVATAASGGGSSSGNPPSASHAPPAGGDPAKLSHGPGETLLTGATAEKVRTAALAAVPGATVIRVETDSAGAAYEAHLRKADGTEVTVKLDSGGTVTTTQSGFGAPPAGAPARQ